MALTGSIKYVVVGCKYSDIPAEPTTPAFWANLMGASSPGLDHYIRDQSYNALNLSGSTATIWVTLPQVRAFYNSGPGGAFNHDLAVQHCITAADPAIFFPAYNGILLQFNGDIGPNVGGTAYLGTKQWQADGQTAGYRTAWMSATAAVSQKTWAHELLHTFGLMHSSGSMTYAYSSQWDVLSGGYVWGTVFGQSGTQGVSTIAGYKALQGWIPAGRIFDAPPGSAQVALERTSLPISSSNKLLARIPIPGTNEVYTVEARRFAGYDVSGAPQGLPGEGVVIHRMSNDGSWLPGATADIAALVMDADGNGNVNDAGAIWLPGEVFNGQGGVEIRVDQALGGSAYLVTLTNPAGYALQVSPTGSGGGRVTSAPTGINCYYPGNNGVSQGACNVGFPSGTTVTLIHAADPGAAFGSWSGDCAGNSCVVDMTRNRTVGATFQTVNHTLTITAGTGTGAGTISGAGISCTINNGAVSGDCTESYAAGTVVPLTQTPTSGHTFAGWGGACSGTGACSVTMNQARTVSAGFTLPVVTHTLTVTAGSGAGTGTVTGTGISCSVNNGAVSGDCTETYSAGTVVPLTQTPTSGHTFAGWGGACSGTGACSVTMNQARTVSAGYTPPVVTHTLNVTAGSGAGSGTVTGTGISCSINNGAASGDCTETYAAGTVVALSQTPTSGYTFVGWGGACSGTGACSVTLDQARTVSAGFAVVDHLLTIVAGGNGSGAVLATNGVGVALPGFTWCTMTAGTESGGCVGLVQAGTTVGFTVSGLDGSTTVDRVCTPAQPNWTFAITSPVSCVFTLTSSAVHTLTIAAGSGTGSGTVTGTGISCSINNGAASGDCTEAYSAGTVVALSQTPTSGHTFAGWGGTCSGTGACAVTMSQARSVSGAFTAPVVNHTLTITAGSGTGSGTVTGSGISCAINNGVASGDCIEPYTAGTVVALTQTPTSGHTFAGWGGACSGMGACSVTMSQARTVSAGFTLPILTPLANGVAVVGIGGTATSLKDFYIDVPTGQAQLRVETSGGAGDVDLYVQFGSLPGSTGTPDCISNGGTNNEVCLMPSPQMGRWFVSLYGYAAYSGVTLIATYQSAQTTVTVSSNPVQGGVALVTSGGGSGAAGRAVTVTATENSGWVFVNWTEAGTTVSTTSVYAFPASSDRALVANFAPVPPGTLTVTAGSGTGSGTVTAAGISCTIDNGAASGDCSEPYAAGTVVALTQTPTSGHTFAGWGGACSGMGACTVTMDQARTVSAGFTAPVVTHTLTITAGSGTGSGTVTGSGISCTISNGAVSGDCTEPYTAGTVVSLTQTPTSGHTFAGWGGACSGTGSCSVTMNQVRTVSAGFTPPVVTHTLTVTAGSGAGSGTVTGSGINCTINNGVVSGDCSEPYAAGTVVALTQAPTIGHTFAGWGGACSGMGACTVTMDQARTVSAGFTAPVVTHTLTVTAGNGAGSGTVTGSGINCTINNGVLSGDCSEPYAAGTVVSLTQAPTSGHTFAGWGGACSGMGACAVTMDQARTVSAGFTAPVVTHTLTITAGSGTGGGTVTATGIHCTINNGAVSGDCTEPYTAGTVVALTQTPTSGHTFAGWGGACSGTGACAVTMNQARGISAAFTAPVVTHTLTITAGSGTGSGTVTATGINCTINNGVVSGDCSEPYAAGTVVALTQVPTSGHTFAGWGGVCSGTGACTVTMDQTRIVSAGFTPEVVFCTVGVVSAPLGGGTAVVTTGGQTGLCGRTVVVSASAAAGWAFMSWSQFGSIVSYQPNHGFVAAASTTLTANFIETAPAIERALQHLLGTSQMTAAEREWFDRNGNNDGILNLGDILALLDRNPGMTLSPVAEEAIVQLQSIPPSPELVP